VARAGARRPLSGLSPSHPRLGWLTIVAGVATATLAVSAVGVPSPSLFAALLVGIAWALLAPSAPHVPGYAVTGAQAVVGVALGSYLRLSTLRAVGAHWPAVALVCLATLGLTVITGLVLARVSEADRVTASFGMIAGGASGIIAISNELGADERLVAVMQYLRVVVIVLITPPVAALLSPGLGARATHAAVAATSSVPAGLAFCVVAAVLGVLLGRLVRLPAASLLGPMLLTGGLTLLGVPLTAAVPAVVQGVAFAVIGLQVGLRFTPQSLRSAQRVIVPALVLIGALLVACALLGLLLASLTGVSALDGYLATTPGGLYAVLATAVGSRADTTFVLSVQLLRLFVMLLAAPALARRLASPDGVAGFRR